MRRGRETERTSTFALLEVTLWLALAGGVLALVLAKLIFGHPLAPDLEPIVGLFFAIGSGAAIALVGDAVLHRSGRRHGRRSVTR